MREEALEDGGCDEQVKIYDLGWVGGSQARTVLYCTV